MAIVRGIDETGEGVFYDVPDAELSKCKLRARRFDSLSDEEKKRLLNGKDELTKEDAHGAIPVRSRTRGNDVEGFSTVSCAGWCYMDVGDGNYVYFDCCTGEPVGDVQVT